MDSGAPAQVPPVVTIACERCRQQKVKCERPNNVPDERCTRCIRGNHECVPHVARRKPARWRQTQATSAAGPVTYVGIPTLTYTSAPQPNSPIQRPLASSSSGPSYYSAFMATAGTAPYSSAPPATGSFAAPYSSAPPATESFAARALPSAELSTTEPHTASTMPVEPLLPAVPPDRRLPPPVSVFTTAMTDRFWESHNHVTTKVTGISPMVRNINAANMQELPRLFKPMCDFFPFVLLPHWPSGDPLLRDRPVLMLAILTAVSYASCSLQRNLASEFRKIATLRVMDGEKSLDLLQGLLVFIAWHHHYMDAQKISIHTLLQMSNGLLADLDMSGIPLSNEAKRAYLGCYYLYSCLGVLEKSRSRFCPALIFDYATQLASAAEYESDRHLPVLMTACQCLEDIEKEILSTTTPAVPDRIADLVRLITHKWDCCQKQVDQSARAWPMTQWLSRIVGLHLYKAATFAPLVDQNSFRAILFRTDMVKSFLHCCGALLDALLDLGKNSPAVYNFVSLVDWLNLLCGLHTLGLIAKQPTVLLPLDSGKDKIFQKLTVYCHTFCDNLRPVAPDQDSNDHFIQRFRQLIPRMLEALETERRSSQPAPGDVARWIPPIQMSSPAREDVDNIPPRLPPIQTSSPVRTEHGGEELQRLPAPFLRGQPSCDIHSFKYPWMFLQGTI